ncbi:MAG: Ig-like domain-containing protein, partial [Thermoplasmata archaeon]
MMKTYFDNRTVASILYSGMKTTAIVLIILLSLSACPVSLNTPFYTLSFLSYSSAQDLSSTLYFDPVNDIQKMTSSGEYYKSEARDYLDIIKMTSGKTTSLGQTWLVFDVYYKGNIRNSGAINYIVALQADGKGFILNYKNGTSKGYDKTNDRVITAATLRISASGTNIHYEINAGVNGITTNQELEWYALAVENVNDEFRYTDMGPNKIVRFVSPSEHATLNGTVSVKGACYPSLAMTISNVEYSIDNTGTWLAVTAQQAGFSSWQFSLDTRTLSDGMHILRVKATENSGNAFYDNLTVWIDQNTLSYPSTSEAFKLNTGQEFEYKAVPAEISLSADLAEAATLNTYVMGVVAKGGVECWEIYSHQDASVKIVETTLNTQVDITNYQAVSDMSLVAVDSYTRVWSPT